MIHIKQTFSMKIKIIIEAFGFNESAHIEFYSNKQFILNRSTTKLLTFHEILRTS